jgi:hypothetical protein
VEPSTYVKLAVGHWNIFSLLWDTNFFAIFIYCLIGVWSCGVLSQRVNQMLRVPNLDGDARRIHRDLSWFGQKKALV